MTTNFIANYRCVYSCVCESQFPIKIEIFLKIFFYNLSTALFTGNEIYCLTALFTPGSKGKFGVQWPTLQRNESNESLKRLLRAKR